MFRTTLLAIALATLPIAPAAAVIAISANPAITPAAPIARPAPTPESSALNFGEIAAAGLGCLVLLLAFGTARTPSSVSA